MSGKARKGRQRRNPVTEASDEDHPIYAIKAASDDDFKAHEDKVLALLEALRQELNTHAEAAIALLQRKGAEAETKALTTSACDADVKSLRIGCAGRLTSLV